jgi:CheY-like chemotaxis protein
MSRILVIDDDPAIRKTIARIVECGGHSVRTISGGAEGIASAKIEPPDLVITDLLMPDQEGTETILQLRKLLPNLPIIAISGAVSHAGNLGPLRLAEMLGADAVLEKPIDVESLLRNVEQLVSA